MNEIAAAAWLVAQAPPRPETWWPTSWAGWLGLVVALYTFAKVLWQDRKSVVAAAIKPAMDEAARIDAHYRDTVSRLEGSVNMQLEHIERSIAKLGADEERNRNEFRGSIEANVNGWSKRIEENRDRLTSQDTILSGITKTMAESEMDRRALHRRIDDMLAHTNQRIDELRADLTDFRRETRESAKGILEAIHSRRGTP